MEGKEISFDAWIKQQEVLLRGAYLRMTIDFEFHIIGIIKECFKGNMAEIKTYYKDKSGHGKDLCELTLFERLELCRIGISKVNIEYYNIYKNDFVNIENLRQIRNKFAHQKIDGFLAIKDKTELTFHKLKNNLKVEMTNYKTEDLWKHLFDTEKVLKNTVILMSKALGIQEPEFS